VEDDASRILLRSHMIEVQAMRGCCWSWANSGWVRADRRSVGVVQSGLDRWRDSRHSNVGHIPPRAITLSARRRPSSLPAVTPVLNQHRNEMCNS